MAGSYNQDTLERKLESMARRMDHIEAKLVQIAQFARTQYIPFKDADGRVPDDIVALAREGKTLEAVARYRELTGADVAEARAIIGAL